MAAGEDLPETSIEDLLQEDAAARAGRPDAPVDLSAPTEVVELPELPSPARAYAGALARAGRAMLAPTPGSGPRSDAARVPQVALAAEARLDQERLDAYRHLIGDQVGASDGESTPPGFVHISLFGMQLALMSRPDFPLPMLGMVHVANRIEQLRTLTCAEPLTARTWARALALRPVGGEGHLATQVELVTEVRTEGAVAWQGVSTYLARSISLPGLPVLDRPERLEFAGETPTGGWEATRAHSTAYARVSGDRNPIHTSTLAAKAFGFPRTIAHGMDTAARALAALGPARGEAFTWDVTFAAPVLVPGRVALRVARVADLSDSAQEHRPGWLMDVWNPRKGLPHLRATLADGA